MRVVGEVIGRIINSTGEHGIQGFFRLIYVLIFLRQKSVQAVYSAVLPPSLIVFMSDNIGVEEAGRQDRQVRSEVEIKLRQLEMAMSSYTMPALVKHA